jgi:hypothetical protein
MPRLTESPLPHDDEDGEDPSASPQPHQDSPSPSLSALPSPEQTFQERPSAVDAQEVTPPNPPEQDSARPIPVRSQTSHPSAQNYEHRTIETPSATSIPESQSQSTSYDNPGEYFDEHEFGGNYAPKGRTVGAVKPQTVERSDTGGSSGSIVAAMRSRYTSTVRLVLKYGVNIY